MSTVFGSDKCLRNIVLQAKGGWLKKVVVFDRPSEELKEKSLERGI
jgi:hypothetical protein